MTLTADDVAALRLAEDVTFHYFDGRGFIRAHMRMPAEGRILTAREQRAFPLVDQERVREIAVETTMFGYDMVGGSGWRLDTEPKAAAFHMIHAAAYSDRWATIAGLLRTGDVLTCAWAADNNTDILRDHGLHTDELVLVVRRGKARPMHFQIARVVGPDNTARMIRRHG